MKIRHNELRIDEENPFLNCKLDRQQYADILTNVVSAYADGFVLAINNEWGTGKTTFVKMWQQHLRNNDFKTIYFNTWENDFDSDPLVAILAELKGLTDVSNRTAFKAALKKGARLSKDVLPEFLKALAKPYVDAQAVLDAFGNVTKATAEILEAEINDYVNKKESIKEFRTKLEAFVEKTASGKPLIVVIDELDRCRPSFAVEVLEQMKHFFSVPGIVFVLSIDKQHLAASVRGFYGSEQINTDEYLRRFIDLEYSIPKPSAEQFCKYLYEYYDFNEFFKSAERYKYDQLRGDGEKFVAMSSHLLQKVSPTLRQMEKIFGQTRLILNSFAFNQFVWPEVLFVLVYLAVLKRDLYTKLRSKEISIQELNDEVAKFFPDDERIRQGFIYTLARLLILYNNDHDYKYQQRLFEEVDGKRITTISSAFGNDLADALYYVNQESGSRDSTLSYLGNKIDLTESLKFAS